MSEALEMGEQVDDATRRFVDQLAGVDPGMWVAPPSIGRWSMSEIVEHVTIANENLLRRLEDALAPLTSPPDASDDEMPYLFYSSEEPPHVAAPTGAWTDLDDGVARLRASADAISGWSRTTSLELRGVGAAHPVFGVLDGVQWVRFASVHTWRHRAQVRAVRAGLAT